MSSVLSVVLSSIHNVTTVDMVMFHFYTPQDWRTYLLISPATWKTTTGRQHSTSALWRNCLGWGELTAYSYAFFSWLPASNNWTTLRCKDLSSLSQLRATLKHQTSFRIFWGVSWHLHWDFSRAQYLSPSNWLPSLPQVSIPRTLPSVLPVLQCQIVLPREVNLQGS